MDGLTVTLRIMAGCAVFAVLVYKLDSVRKVRWVIAAVVVAMIWPTLEALLGVWQRGGLALNGANPQRIGDSSVGASLALILIVCLAFFLGAGTRTSRLIWGGLSGFFGVGLLFSYGRAGWISLVVGLVFVGLIQHRRLLVILPVLLLLIVLLVPAIPQRFADISADRLDNRSDSTLAGRLHVWRAALEIYPEHPLLGVGTGTGRYRVGERLGAYATMIHNDYLSVLLETGVIGLVLFLLWQGQWFVAVVGVHKHARTNEERTLALAVAAALVVSLVSRLTENLVLDAYDLYPLSALVAAALVLPRIRAERGNPETGDRSIERSSS
jgi:O-antigen ligase